MLLSVICPPLARRLAGHTSPLHPIVSLPGPAASKFSSAPLNLTTDDADEPRDPADRNRHPSTAYVEPSRSRRWYVERFLRHELGLSWSRAEREAARCRHLSAAGLPLMAENLAFLTDRGVLRQHLQEDVDVLGVGHGDLLRVHSLIGSLPDADYRLYYPLSRARPDTVTELFRRLPTRRRSNLVHELADVLLLPELTVSRAVSRMATQITKTSKDKLLNNAKLLIDLGVSPSELRHSLYLLRLSGTRLRRRQQQCRKHGIPLLARYLGMSDDNFLRRVSVGGRLVEQTADVAAAVARRLGVSRDEVVIQTRRSDVLQTLTSSRLESITGLLEEAGYSRAERVSALLTVYRGRPERLRDRLEVCRRLGRPRPSLSLLAMDQRRFERTVARWERGNEVGLVTAEEREVCSDERIGPEEETETEAGGSVGYEAGDRCGVHVWEQSPEVIGTSDGECDSGETGNLEGGMLGNEHGNEEMVTASEEGVQVNENSGELVGESVCTSGLKTVGMVGDGNFLQSEGKQESERLEDDPEYLTENDVLKKNRAPKDALDMSATPCPEL